MSAQAELPESLSQTHSDNDLPGPVEVTGQALPMQPGSTAGGQHALRKEIELCCCSLECHPTLVVQLLSLLPMPCETWTYLVIFIVIIYKANCLNHLGQWDINPWALDTFDISDISEMCLHMFGCLICLFCDIYRNKNFH